MLLFPVVSWEALLVLFRARTTPWQSTLLSAEEAAQHPWVREETGETWSDSIEDGYVWFSESEIPRRRRATTTHQRGRKARREDAKSLGCKVQAADMAEREEDGVWSWVWV